MKWLFLVALWLIFSAYPVLWAQRGSFKKTYRLWQQDKISREEARARFSVWEDHRKHGVAARYYGTLLRFGHIRSLQQAQQENSLLLALHASMRGLSAKRIRKMQKHYGVDSMKIMSLRERIQLQMVAQTRVMGTFAALDTLQTLEAPLPFMHPLIDTTIHQIVLYHLDTKRYDEAVVLLKKYANRIRPADYRRSRALYQRSWEMFQEQYPLCQIERYAQDYPRSFVARDCWRTEVQQLLCADSIASLLDFLERTPWTALEHIVHQVLLQKDTSDLVLTPTQRIFLETLHTRQGLFETMRRRQVHDTIELLPAVRQYIIDKAPRYSAFKLLEHTLQYLLETKQPHSAIHLLQSVRSAFPDTLPRSCHSDFDFQKRVRPWIDGKLPILRQTDPPTQIEFLTALNTPQGDESHPVVSADGRELYFAACNRPDYPAADQNIFVSLRSDTGWTLPHPLRTLSGAGDDIPLSITADGQEMLLSIQGKMHLSRRTSQDWSTPEPVRLSGLGSVGQGFLSADGQVLLLEGSYSAPNQYHIPDQDIFVAFRHTGNTWSMPVALGSDVNTDAQEGDPFLSADGTTLWFTSDGWPGLGKSDLFRTERTDPGKWTLWKRPRNAGKNINDTQVQTGIYSGAEGVWYTTRLRGEASDLVKITN